MSGISHPILPPVGPAYVQPGQTTPEPAPIWVKGDKGDKGDAGASSGYEHTQVTPNTMWVVQHNLGYRPGGIQAISGGTPIVGVVSYQSDNVMILTFLEPVAGSAFVS